MGQADARSITVRDLAALMGQNPATHHRHNGKRTDETGLEEAVDRATGRANQALSTLPSVSG